MGIDAIITIGFYLVLLAISFTIFIFVGINVPLIVFDKALYIFDIVSGGDLVKSVIFGNEFSWSTENILFTIYLIIALISFIVLFVVFIVKMVGKTFKLNNEQK